MLGVYDTCIPINVWAALAYYRLSCDCPDAQRNCSERGELGFGEDAVKGAVGIKPLQRQAPNREARMPLVSLPCSERVQPLFFRLTTVGPQAALRSVVVCTGPGLSNEEPAPGLTGGKELGQEAFHSLA